MSSQYPVDQRHRIAPSLVDAVLSSRPELAILPTAICLATWPAAAPVALIASAVAIACRPRIAKWHIARLFRSGVYDRAAHLAARLERVSTADAAIYRCLRIDALICLKRVDEAKSLLAELQHWKAYGPARAYLYSRMATIAVRLGDTASALVLLDQIELGYLNPEDMAGTQLCRFNCLMAIGRFADAKNTLDQVRPSSESLTQFVLYAKALLAIDAGGDAPEAIRILDSILVRDSVHPQDRHLCAARLVLRALASLEMGEDPADHLPQLEALAAAPELLSSSANARLHYLIGRCNKALGRDWREDIAMARELDVDHALSLRISALLRDSTQ